MIYSLVIDGQEVLFQDKLDETLFSTEKSLRWGIPIMFPQAGSLTEEEMQKLGYKQPQHGIIRNASFDVIKQWEDFVILQYNRKTEPQEYKIPLDFDFQVKYTLWETKISMEFFVKNTDAQKDFAISPGLHPYFCAPDFSKANVVFLKPEIQEAFINEFHLFSQEGTIQPEIPEDSVQFAIKDIGTITLSYTKDFQNLWLRKQHDIEGVLCVEPTYGTPGNIVRNPVIIPARKDYTFGMDIEFSR